MFTGFLQRLSGYTINFCSFLITQFRYSRRNRRFQPESVKKILTIKLEHIGDVILTLPALALLRENFPAAKITLLVGSWAKEIMEMSDLVDEIFIYDSNRYVRNGTGKNSFSERKNLFSSLRSVPFDLIVSLSSDWWTLFFSLVCKCKYRVDIGGVRTQRKIRKLFPLFFKRSTLLTSKQHIVDMNLETLKMIDLEVNVSEPYLSFENSEVFQMKEFLSEHEIAEKDLKIIIHPGTEWRERAWGPQKFARIADYLISHHSAKVIITGGKKELDVADEMSKNMKEESLNLAGKTSLTMLTALLKYCDLFIGNDGGPMHIAAAVRTPVIALFGPQDPKRFGPIGKQHRVLYKEVECSPCRQHTCSKSFEERCMNLIQEEEVISCIDDFMKIHFSSQRERSK